MANRHAHKKLRAEIRARINVTGESYQQARERILSGVESVGAPRTDLVPFSYFGLPGTLATIESRGISLFAFVPSATLWSRAYPSRLPTPLLRTMSGSGDIQ